MRKFTSMPTFLLIISLFILFYHSSAGDTLTPVQSLVDGETLVSSGGRFALGFFNPTNSTNRYVGIWYYKIPVHTVVWVANRQNPIKDTTGSLTIAANGSLVITNQNSTIIWSSTATSISNPVAQLLDIGNFVVKEENIGNTEIFAWQSFDHPTDTLLPGQKIRWNLISGVTPTITAWRSNNDPSLGTYCISFENHGIPQIFLYDGLVKKWRIGSWNGIEFSGIPQSRISPGYTDMFTNNKDESSYLYYISSLSILSRTVVNQTGEIQVFVWLGEGDVWNLFWSAPNDDCKAMSWCGPYGVCDPNNPPICKCLQGFEPKSLDEWSLRDWSGGCVRKTILDCRNGTDGFLPVNNLKIPDTSNSTVDMSMNLEECRAMCLSNCSCTAYASANISGSGSGCIIWATALTDMQVYTNAWQDLYIRLAGSDLDSTSGQSHKNRQVTVAVSVSLVSMILLLACIGCFIWRRKKRRLGTTSLTGFYPDESVRRNDLELPVFDFGIIVTATDNFSLENKLGAGGFGPVYKGKLKEGQEIAVKRLAKTSQQGVDEFKNEVMLIAKLQHRNLVRLLGCCIQGEERLLIYEYMHNNSLDAFLFDKGKGALLDWQTRYNIIVGIARGLLYLHQDSRFRIIHRDLKAGNVLLDKEMIPKISDFGMARIFEGDETEANTRTVVGTYGYMSPEYAMNGIFSVKSDVFSFGVLVLEIISGKKNSGVYQFESHLSLLGQAWGLWNEGRSLELVDESLGISFPRNEAMRCIKLGLLCVQERPEDRPTMSSVVVMLGSDSLSLPHPKQPGFVPKGDTLEIKSSSSKQESSSVNDVTLTSFVAR